MSAQVGDLKVHYSARGSPTYLLEISHPGLKKHRVIRGNDPAIVQRKAQLQVEEWTEKWSEQEKREKEKRNQRRQQEPADSRTAEAVAELQALENLLAQTLSIDDAIDWDELKDRSPFPEQPPSVPAKPPRPSTDVALSILDKLIKSRRERKAAEVQQRLAKYEAQVKRMDQDHAQKVKQWKERAAQFLEEQNRSNEAVDRKKDLYLSKDPEAILDYCDLVLSNSQYPDWIPQEWDMDLNPETGILVVDYALPSLDDLPTLSEVRYVRTRDELTERHITDPQKNRLYDGVVYQITLRTIHELFEADVLGVLKAIAFNGMVTSIDRATGHETTACILSVHAGRDEFLTGCGKTGRGNEFERVHVRIQRGHGA